MAQYDKQLTDGLKAMFKKYPETFKMPVYATHRDFRYDDGTYKAIRTYAPQIEMLGEGNGVKSSPPTLPYPIPQDRPGTAVEPALCLGHRERARVYDQAVVYADGKIAWARSSTRSGRPRTASISTARPR
ncbi:DUF1329 domain-containing protein [Cupriavidus basilensis]